MIKYSIIETKAQKAKGMEIVIYEPSARRHFSHMSTLFEAQATKERVFHLRECAEYFFAHRGLYNSF
jgi:hypothetical protein